MKPHALARLPLWARLGATSLQLLGGLLFLAAWLAAMVAGGWGLSADILLELGPLLHGAFESTPLLFWLAFGAHLSAAVVLVGVNRVLQARLALPRGFRALVGVGSSSLAGLGVLCFLLVPVWGPARALLGPLLVVEALLFAALTLLPLREMWGFSRYAGGRKRVLVVGGGFGGLYTAMSLDAKLGWHDDVELTLVDRKNYFLFPPLLPSVATGAIETRQVTTPFRKIFEATKVRFRKETVERVDLAARCVHTRVAVAPDPRTGELCEVANRLDYDLLVLAPGAITNTFRVPGAATHAFFMRELGDAIAVRNQIIDCFEQAATEADPATRRELLRFVVVGAGPTGVELAAEAQDLVHNVLLARYPELDAGEVEVVLVQSGAQVLPGWNPTVAALTQARLQHIAVRLVLGTRVVEVCRNEACLQNGERLRTRTVVWCTGVEPAALMRSLGIPTERNGQVRVNPDLSLPGHPEVFVLGDVAFCEQDGKPLGALAQVAMQQGSQTGPNLVRRLQGRPTRPFRYFDYGSLVCVGEHYAVVDLMGMRFGGVLAWFVWRTLYLSKLVGVGNRIRVVLDWTLDLLVERSIAQINSQRQDLLAAELEAAREA